MGEDSNIDWKVLLVKGLLLDERADFFDRITQSIRAGSATFHERQLS